jgi:hypothetical protein
MVSRRLVSIALGVLVAGCGSDSPSPVEPLTNAAPIPVTLTSASSLAADQFDVRGTSGGIDVVWDFESLPCVIATVSGEQAGDAIDIKVRRGSNPLANCVPGPVRYRYLLHASSVAAGTYGVRLIDEVNGERAREVGRRMVRVTP